MSTAAPAANRRRFALLTDSTCDLPAELIAQYDVGIVPLYLLWGDQQLRDTVDIDNDTFYARLPQDPIHPKTSQPTPADFARAIAAVDADEALILTISSGLSGTYASAVAAAGEAAIPVHVYDSLSVSMGLGWQVLAAARAREAGGDVQDMIAAAQAARQTMSLLFTCDTLEYLHRGGRIGGGAKLLGTLLQLKPMLVVDHTTGLIDAAERTRTRKKALIRLVELTMERVGSSSGLRVAVIHGGAFPDAESLAEQICAQCQPSELLYGAVSPALGVHGGPGLVGIVACRDAA